MASLFFTCPTTHRRAPTGIETDVQSLQAAWKATLKVKCPHCGEVHKISVRETYWRAAGWYRPVTPGHLGLRGRSSPSVLPVGRLTTCTWPQAYGRGALARGLGAAVRSRSRRALRSRMSFTSTLSGTISASIRLLRPPKLSATTATRSSGAVPT
jgi:hypothetical protein